MARRRRHADDEHEEGHSNAERWLVTYADMVTLLMVLFIVMFALSVVDQKKFDALKEGLAQSFGHASTILNGSNAVSDQAGRTQSGPMQVDGLQSLSSPDQAAVDNAVKLDRAQAQQRTYDDARAEASRLLDIWHRIERSLKRQGLRDDVQATIDQRGLVVSLVSRHVVFEPNVADLSPRGQRLVDTVAPVLAEVTEPLEIDGHTNQIKVKPKFYPTDWELSAARAVTVLRRLQEVDGLPAKRLSATGYGHTRPLINPRKPGAQTVNKRADIVVLSQAPAETRALLAQVGGDLTIHDTTHAEGQS